MRLGIVGAGPKALAIASKAVVLRRIGFTVPEIVILEKSDVAAHWLASSGLTNGRQPLGTSPEKDVGFPYTSFHWGSDRNALVNGHMQGFSWGRFLIEQSTYADWIDRGRPAPSHKRWAEYLRWVYSQVAAETRLIRGEVSGLCLDGDAWSIRYETPEHGTMVERVDGVVMTGPGKAYTPVPLPEDVRIYSVRRFWSSLEGFRALQQGSVAVVGTGETAASIAAALGLANGELNIDIISPLAMNYSRGESYVENHVYSDPFQGNWFQLTAENRRDFIARTDRGVFSVVTKQVLDQLESIHVVPGALTSVEVDGMGQLLVGVHYDQEREIRQYDTVIVATGFDHLGFLQDLMPAETQCEVLKCAALPGWSAAAVEGAIDEALSLIGVRPRLHLPMLAAMSQGPGFANLSCLGRLSDQILSAYVDL